ncbi:MAG: hypothetical protein C5B55_12130, partial [Blastocatellia bacterium]
MIRSEEMKSTTPPNIRANTQGRQTRDTHRQSFFTCPYHRSLNPGREEHRPECFGFAPLRVAVSLLFALLFIPVMTRTVLAQDVEDTIRIKTRVVFLDALVKDKKTGDPISNLSTNNFTVLDEGRQREITYFTREGQARKPLALVLILDLRGDGAGRFLKQPEILKAMEDELAKLPPEDEVAILAMDINDEDEKRVWLTDFTHDRTKFSAALARVREFINVQHEDSDRNAAKKEPDTDAQQTTSTATPAASPSPAADAPKPNDVVETETIKGRKGAVVTRTLHTDGSVDVKRTNKSGDVTVDFGDVYDMAAAVREATKRAQELRPNSQPSLVWVSDGIAPIFYEDRDATEQILIRNNVIFSSLTVELRTLFKFLLPVGKPIAGWLGMSLYGSAKLLAQRSGGEAVKVGRVKDYGTGLAKIIGNLTARYSLGFALAE